MEMSSKPQSNLSVEDIEVLQSHSSTFCFATCGSVQEICFGTISSSDRLLGTKSWTNDFENGSGGDNRSFFLEFDLTCRGASVKFSLGLKGATCAEADPGRADFDM